MSTNFEIRYNICRHCDRYDTLHMGSSWRILRAYDETPFGKIASWADWRQILRQDPVELWDEYGRQRSIEDVIAAWQPDPLAAAESNAEWSHYFSTQLGDYTDPEGFHMSRRAFS